MTSTTLDTAGPVAARRRSGRARILLRRIGFYLVTAWVAITLNFLIPRLMPGNPVDVIVNRLQQHYQVSPQTQKAFQVLFGAPHTSLLTQYWQYLGQLAHLDFGLSIFYYPTPVSTLIAQGLPWTLCLVGVTTVIAFLIGTGLGIVSGMRPGSRLDGILSPLATLTGAMPYFWVATVVILLLAVNVPAFPTGNGYDVNLSPGFSWAFLSSAVAHAVLPGLTIVVSSVGGWLLGMRNMMVTTIAEDYVLLAEAKGLRRWRVMLSYAARNAMLPQVSGFAIAIGTVVGGSLLAESVFSYPGVGYLLYQGVANLDYPLMQAMFLVISLSLLLANFIADSVYVLLDPRTRETT